GLRRIENAQHDLLAKERRTGAHAEVDGATLRQLHLDATVLWDASLGDIEPRHHLEPRRELRSELHGRLRDLLQHPVHAQAHTIGLLEGLEVDVGGAAADGIQHHFVDEADYRRIFDVIAPDLVLEIVFAA